LIVKVPLDKIHPNPYQPESRLNVPEEVAERFGRSILEHGLLQIPVARRIEKPAPNNIPPYEMYFEMGDGWLRLSGFRWLVQNGHPEFNEMPLDIRELTDQQMADMILEANTVRKDMTPIDEAKLFKRYLEDFGVTQAELAKSHNLTQGALANKLGLLELPEEIQQKIISREITETHARTLLQLEDHKQIEKMAQKVIVQNLSVANLDREIKATLWSNTVPLYDEEGNTEKIPIFDREECPKCEHYRLLKDPWKDDEKKPRCAYKKCWKEKQNAALDAQNKKALEKLAARGIKHIVEYDYRTMAFLHSEWDECKTCDKRAACKEVWGKGFETVCLDRPCHDRLAAAERKAAEEKRLAEKLREEQEINRFFNEKVVRPGKHIPLTIIDCILRSRQYSYGQEEMLEKLTRVFDPEPPKGQKATIKSFLASCRKLDEEELFYHVLPRLAFEVFELGVNDRVQIEQILQSFQTKPAPEKSKKKDQPDQRFTLKEVGNSWLAIDTQGTVIAISDNEEQTRKDAIESFKPVETELQPKVYTLNHTYRISFKDHSFADVTAQNVNAAITAAGRDPQDVAEVRVYKSSGKVGTSGYVGSGWGKCTEIIEMSGDDPNKPAADLDEDPEEDMVDEEDCNGNCDECGEVDCGGYGEDQGWKCKVCGCTDDNGCIVEGKPGEDIIFTCHWVAPNLCSACQGKEEDDPLAGLVIRTAAKEGEKHEIKLGNITIRYSEIKECARLLGVNMNWGDTTEEIINTLKSMPESSNRDLLIAILADQSKEKEQVMPCADCVFSKNCSKKLGRNFLAPDGEGGYKCVQKIQSAAKKPADYTPTLEPPCDYCAKGSKNGGSCDTSLYHCEDGPGSVLVCEEMAPVKSG